MTLPSRSPEQLNAQLLNQIKDVRGLDSSMTFNSAMIEVEVPITKMGKLVNSHRWICMYSESPFWSGIHGTYMDSKLGSHFAFTVTKRWINLIPKVGYNPQSLVDFYLWITKVISKYAVLMTYEQYIEKHKDDEVR